jgi:hypothetical protein
MRNKMAEKTTLQISKELKSALDEIKYKGDTYEDVITRLLSSKDDIYQSDVVLTMTNEQYRVVMNRQDWDVARNILIAAVVK